MEPSEEHVPQTVEHQPPAEQPEKQDNSAPNEAAEEDNTNYIKTELGEMNVIESLCPKCEQNGTTRLMITDIPHFRQVIVSSFECPHCGESNNEVTFGGVFGAKKVRYELEVKDAKDMDRQVVKSEFATITIPELQLEIPPESQKGTLNTVEGILQQTKDGLEFQQPLRKIQNPEVHDQIEAFCHKLEEYATGKVPFTFVINDPSGNSYVEGRFSYYHPTKDPQLTKYESERTEIDRQILGVAIDYNTERTAKEEQEVEEGAFEDISRIPCDCPACSKAGHLLMHECDIPYFKETVIMAFKCDYCGYKSNEVKTGGKISERGLRLTLSVETEADLKRDVLKSETATLLIPELSLELSPGTLGGFFSSVEGTITQVRDQLANLPQAAFAVGDAASDDSKSMMQFVKELDDLLDGKHKFTFILDDPLANVYIQNPRSHLPPPENEDKQLVEESYVRTEEQNEELGINDMHVGEQHEEAEGEKTATAAENEEKQ